MKVGACTHRKGAKLRQKMFSHFAKKIEVFIKD